MPNLRLADLTAEIEANVRRALLEDVGSGDITAQLIPAERLAKATIITRDAAIISGTAWVDAVFRQLDPRVAVHWQVRDGDRVSPDQVLFHLEGPARSLLTGERSALNFLQMLSGVATRPATWPTLSPAPKSSCWTPARPCPGCAWPRNTQSPAAAAITTASACTMPS